MKLFVTYGWGYDQRNNFSVVEGENIPEIFAKIHVVCGQGYANAYTEADFAHQPKDYGITEIPLQRQTRAEETDE